MAWLVLCFRKSYDGRMRRCLGSLLIVGLLVTSVQAHFSMLLPATPFGKKGVPITFLYQWGHPYEHQLFDAPPPGAATLVDPDGKSRIVTKDFEKIRVKGEGKNVDAYQIGRA